MLLVAVQTLHAVGPISVPGVVASSSDGAPVEFATIVLGNDEQWGMTDQQGHFVLQMSHGGRTTVKASCVGYEPAEAVVTVAPGMDTVRLVMRPSNLMLEQVVVTAQRKTEHATTSYLIDSHALDNQ